MNQLDHVSGDELAAWLVGTLADEDALRVETHLEACDECARKLDSIDRPKDTFLDSLRAASETVDDRKPFLVRKEPARDAESFIGTRLGKYKITAVLGSGGMGTVFKARDTAIERDVAIKMLHPDLTKQESFLKRFMAEAKSAGKLNHRNVVTLHDVASAEGTHFLVMEIVEGGSAGDHLNRKGAYFVPEATRIMIDACRGVAAAHGRGMVHRDIKPDNLLIARDGTVKVSDFGIAKQDESLDLTKSGQIIGTPHFMSPQQCAGEPVDHRSDIYSLGATYFSLLCGKTPYEDESMAGLIRLHFRADSPDPPDPRKYDAAIPDACAAIIARAMAKSPDDRYQSADEMLADLEAVSDTLATRPARARRAAVAVFSGLAITLVLGVVCFAGNFFSDDEEPVEINIAFGTEKAEWLEWAVAEFEQTEEGKRIKVNLIGMGSGEGAGAVLDGPGGTPIHVWSPASSAYGDTFDRQWKEKHDGKSPISESKRLVLTPLVFVIWRDRYEALLSKHEALDFDAIRQAMADGDQWAGADNDWGRFKFGHTDQGKSNSGLLTLVLAAYDFYDQQTKLTPADISDPGFQQWLTQLEEGVERPGGELSHSTGTLMREMILEGPSRFDCVMVYENVAIEHLESAEGRWKELVVVYPERNIWNENPYFVLDVSWSNETHRAAATHFQDFLLTEPIQRQAIQHGFRPGNTKVALRFPESPFVQMKKYGIQIDIPKVYDPPSADVVAALISASRHPQPSEGSP